jgi:hypothetical protein
MVSDSPDDLRLQLLQATLVSRGESSEMTARFLTLVSSREDSEVLEVARCRRSRYYGLYDNVYGDNSMYCLSVLCALFRRFTDVPVDLPFPYRRGEYSSLSSEGPFVCFFCMMSLSGCLLPKTLTGKSKKCLSRTAARQIASICVSHSGLCACFSSVSLLNEICTSSARICALIRRHSRCRSRSITIRKKGTLLKTVFVGGRYLGS